jgi:hypothetical protein
MNKTVKSSLKNPKSDHAKRRTSVNPPTVEEALLAASGLTSDPRELVELASDLIGLPRQQVEPLAAGFLERGETRRFGRSGRVVVVERKSRRGVNTRPSAM